ncbi:hypothetical protein Dcar01_02708 [Deinococcus carri]|uniref:Uncharacterized protein n=2 Tax=Deinococcus carri TaxID=1211323 RepID=A0ABP9W9D6_9DEIO
MWQTDNRTVSAARSTWVHLVRHGSDLPEPIAAANTFVLVPLFEGLPRAALEGMAASPSSVEIALYGTCEAFQAERDD